MIYYIGGLVACFLAGAAVMFFVLKNNPKYLNLEDIIMAEWDEKKDEVLMGLEDVEGLPAKYRKLIEQWIRDNF